MANFLLAVLLKHKSLCILSRTRSITSHFIPWTKLPSQRQRKADNKDASFYSAILNFISLNGSTNNEKVLRLHLIRFQLVVSMLLLFFLTVSSLTPYQLLNTYFIQDFPHLLIVKTLKAALHWIVKIPNISWTLVTFNIKQQWTSASHKRRSPQNFNCHYSFLIMSISTVKPIPLWDERRNEESELCGWMERAVFVFVNGKSSRAHLMRFIFFRWKCTLNIRCTRLPHHILVLCARIQTQTHVDDSNVGWRMMLENSRFTREWEFVGKFPHSLSL